MQGKRKTWKESITELPKTKLVFLDESGVNTNMTRRYGRAIEKQRVADAVPLNTPQTATVLSAMRLNGQFVCRTFEGGTTKGHFLEYLREDLLPCLKKGDIVVMDNLKVHHTKGVEELLRSAGAVPLCLPPYARISIRSKKCQRGAAYASGTPKKAIIKSKSSSVQTGDKPSRPPSHAGHNVTGHRRDSRTRTQRSVAYITKELLSSFLLYPL